MAKIRKAIFRNGMVMLSLLAVMVLSSSVAQAQSCFARRASGTSERNMVRAEGMTELLSGIELLCTGGGGTGFAPPATTEISIELNTSVTNETNEDGDMVMGLMYTAGSPGLGTADHWTMTDANDDNDGDKQGLSDDGMTISWAIASADLNIDARDDTGGTMTIGNIMVNASALGDGADVTAAVMVNGVAASGSPVKLADVMTGLEVTVTAASGLQCLDGEAKATIRVVEGFNSAFRAVADDDTTADVDESERNSVLTVNFRSIADGVTVTVAMAGSGEAMEDDGTDLAPLTLQPGDNHEEGVVDLDEGAGYVRYTFSTETYDHDADAGTDEVAQVDDGTKEWNDVVVTFTWDAGEVSLDMGTVTVSYHPVSDDTDDSPRYVSGPTNMAYEIEECVTSLVFPFVTNMHGYDTGIALTNTSVADGSCTVDYSGTADDDMVDVMAESTATFGLSAMEPGFQGYIEMTCNFRNGKGFAFISNGFGSMGGPTAAQGYLVSDELQSSP